jgi:signal peptidase I
MTEDLHGAVDGPAELQSGQEGGRRSSVRDYAEILLFAVLASLFLKFFVVEAYRIPTGSMEDTLLAGDFVLVNKFIYGARTPRYIPFTSIKIPSLQLPAILQPRRGDVIVFEFPGAHNEDRSDVVNFVKRCVALPGDTLSIVNKRVFVNGRELQPPRFGREDRPLVYPPGFHDYRIFPRGSLFNEDNFGPLVIPKAGTVIALNERNLSEYEKAIEHEGHSIEMDGPSVMIDGKHDSTYTLQKDYYFMMGDNRDNSLDSRFWGFVPSDLIIGKVFMVYWSWEENGPSGFLMSFFSTRWNRIGNIVY